MLKVFCFIITSFIIASYSYANEWETSVAENGMVEISTSTKSIIFGTERVVLLHIYCSKYEKHESKTAKGMCGLEFDVSSANEIKEFYFGDFEGPTPNAEAVMTIKANPGQEHVIRPAGWYSAVDPVRFAFGFDYQLKGKNVGVVGGLLDDIKNGANSIEITITDSREPSKKIHASFSVIENRDDFQKIKFW
jgi:hypothetical protein